MERERLELDEPGSLGVVHSSSADFAHYCRASHTSPRVSSTPIDEDAIVQRISRAFSSALNESRASGSQVSLLNRLVSHKVSISFSGDSLDYLHFKRAFSESTALGGYSDHENVMRLYDCLRGDARDAVRDFMLTTQSARKMLGALDMQYARKDNILRKLVESLRKLLS